MMRVLHVVPDLVPYGLENMVAGLVGLLDRTRFESGIVSLYAESANGLEPGLRRQGISLFHLNKKRGFDFRMYSRLHRVLREYRPHILHTHNYVLRYAWPAALAAGVPQVVHTIHNVADREVDRFGLWLQRIAFRRGVAPVAIADAVSQSFRKSYGIAEAATIPNAIAVAHYRNAPVAREDWRRAAGIRPDEFVYLCVARFSEQKNHKTLLDAFAAGPGRMAGTRLALAGDGELRGELERQVESLGLQSRVTFLGQRSDMPDALAASDAFVLASLWEGNPLSVMEAMAAGRPVVATTVGAIPELVRNGVDGVLVAPGDAQALAGAMAFLAENLDQRSAMGRSAAARAASRFDLPLMVRAYTELYDRLLNLSPDTAVTRPGLVGAAR